MVFNSSVRVGIYDLKIHWTCVVNCFSLILSNPAISKSQGKWKKVRNSGVSKYPGKRKIRNSESSFNKIQCIIKKDTD